MCGGVGGGVRCEGVSRLGLPISCTCFSNSGR